MDPDSIMRLMAENRQQMGNRQADIPKLFNQFSPTSDPIYQSLQGNQADKVKQLFDHDTQLAQVKFQPQEASGPHAEGYAPPGEMILDPMIGLRASSNQYKSTANEAIDLLTQMQTRKDTLSDSLNKALQMIEFGIKAKELEQKSLESELSGALKLKELNTPKPTAEDKTNDRFQELVQDVKKGIKLGQALTKYGAYFDPNEIFSTYNSAGSPWGPVKASPQELAKYGIDIFGKSAAKPLSSVAQEHIANVSSALRAIKTYKDNLSQDSLRKAHFPHGLGDPSAQILQNASDEFTDVFLRSRTGAALNESEIKRYNQNKPSMFDTEESIKDKLVRMEKLYRDIYNRLSGSSYDSDQQSYNETYGDGNDWEIVK